MDDVRVLERLGRVEELERAGAPAALVLVEVGTLLAEAERWARRAGDDGAPALDAVVRARTVLAEGRAPVHAL